MPQLGAVKKTLAVTVTHLVCVVQENFSKGGRAGIFDLYPVVLYLFVRCFLILFGGRFGRVSRGTLPILTTIHAVLVELQRVLLLFKTFLLFFD